jgi:hypothetical protein
MVTRDASLQIQEVDFCKLLDKVDVVGKDAIPIEKGPNSIIGCPGSYPMK